MSKNVKLKTELRKKFCEIDQNIRNLYMERGELQEKCPHEFDSEGFARCSICGLDKGGWACNASPDKICHYETFEDEEGKRYVCLFDNTLFYDIPADHDYFNESVDHCIFCGQPEERK